MSFISKLCFYSAICCLSYIVVGQFLAALLGPELLIEIGAPRGFNPYDSVETWKLSRLIRAVLALGVCALCIQFTGWMKPWPFLHVILWIAALILDGLTLITIKKLLTLDYSIFYSLFYFGGAIFLSVSALALTLGLLVYPGYKPKPSNCEA